MAASLGYRVVRKWSNSTVAMGTMQTNEESRDSFQSRYPVCVVKGRASPWDLYDMFFNYKGHE